MIANGAFPFARSCAQEDSSMKWLSFAVLSLLTVALLGGGVGCNKGDKKTAEGEGGKKLSVKAPGDTNLKQGDTTTINVDITREKFNDPVDLKFTGLPEGIIILEKDLTISKDAATAKLTLKAAADAKPVDDHKVTVAASGGGMKPEATFKLSVKKGADTDKKLTLTAPGNTSINQGETAAINVDITRDKFNEPVVLKFTGLPEGVTVMEKDLTISKDATTTKLTLNAGAEAKAVDDHKVTVIASGGGMTQEATFNVSVRKKS
jgi:uncharacterized membrane protein